MHSFMEDTGINERYFHGLELRLAVRDEIADVAEVIDKSMLLEFGPRKLSHVFSCALLGNIGCAANNLPPQS